MKKISKKILAILLAAMCAFSVFAVTASAEENTAEEAYFFDSFLSDLILKDGVYYEVYSDEFDTYASVVDFEINENGESVVAASVTIPETIEYNGESFPVTEIGYGAFMDCSTLREITLPETITVIYDYAFCGAAFLEKVVIPETVEFYSFGDSVFEYTPVLGYFAENSDDGAVILGQNVLLAYLGSDKTYTIPEEIDFIADHCFFMSGVEKVNFNENILAIPPYAFASCRNLKSITIPDSILDIREGAFSNCTNLEEVNLGDSLQYIGVKAFENTKIKNIYIGENIAEVAGAFAGCSTLESITVSEANIKYYFKDNALYYSYEDFEYDFTTLEYYLITNKASTFTVPEYVSVIGPYAFYGCKQLENVNIVSAVYVYDNAFAYCDFESFDFSNIVTLSYAAFRGCKNLKSVDLSSVLFVSDSAFENCEKLASVTFSDDIYYIGSRAFANTSLTEVSVGGEDTEIGESAFADCKKLKRVNFNDGVWVIYSHVVANCPELETVFISKTVEYVDYYAFEDCQNVTFQIIQYSDGADAIIEYAEDAENDVTKYEIVGKLNIFERIEKFFSDIFEKILDFFFRW